MTNYDNRAATYRHYNFWTVRPDSPTLNPTQKKSNRPPPTKRNKILLGKHNANICPQPLTKANFSDPNNEYWKVFNIFEFELKRVKQERL